MRVCARKSAHMPSRSSLAIARRRTRWCCDGGGGRGSVRRHGTQGMASSTDRSYQDSFFHTSPQQDRPFAPSREACLPPPHVRRAVAAPLLASPPIIRLPILTCAVRLRYPSGASYACAVQSPPCCAAARPSSACSTSSRAACVVGWGQGRVEDGGREGKGEGTRRGGGPFLTSIVAASFSSYSSPARTCGSIMG